MEGEEEEKKNYNIPSSPHTSASGDQSPHHKEDQPFTLSSPPTCSTRGAIRRIPKPRNVFTMSSNILSFAPPQQALKMEGEEEEDSSDESVGSSTTTTIKKKSHHGSMENIFKPKNHRSTSSNLRQKRSNVNGEEKEVTERLTEENLLLMTELDKIRRKTLALKTCANFSLAAFRGEKLKVVEIEKAKVKKTEEAALRMILHTLLLNSWRKTKSELITMTEENSNLNKTMENLSLQLRVVRHIQALDKEKMLDKNAEVGRSREEVKLLRNQNETIRNSMEKIESELNSLQANIQNLEDSNKSLEVEGVELKETINILRETLDEDRRKYGKLERSSGMLKQDKKKAEDQLTEFTRQNTHWQEKARSYESECWALKMDLDGKDSQVKDIRNICDVLRKEKTDLIRSKSGLKGQMKEMSNKFEQAVLDKEELNKKLEQNKSLLQEQEKLTLEALLNLNNAKKEFTRIEKELLSFKLSNVKRRREWANALYFLFNPVDAFRRSLVQAQNEQSHSQSRISQRILSETH